ncbi:hypothetical protein [Chitinophaga sp.]|uniref:hypothetical protein n=1 Tax=Chitinophaga sp. TaxID=1869181 RepID=UPI002F935E7C
MIRILLITATALLRFTGSNAQVTTHKSYYDNGRLKQVTHQGNYNGCGVPVGTDSLFDASGKLAETISYQHKGKSNTGCHDIITRKTITTYYSNGRRKTLSFQEECYECEPKSYGVWKWYDRNGKLIKSEKKDLP